MSKFRRNIFSNLLAKIWISLLTFSLIPISIKFMGPEHYGLIGFYATLQSCFLALDMGLGTAVNREMSQLVARERKAAECHDVFLILQYFYWFIGILSFALIFVSAPFFAQNWFRLQTLSSQDVENILVLMGVIIGLRLPVVFYQGVLLGLQQQVVLNSTLSILEGARFTGSILVLLIVPTAQSFFQCQLVIIMAQTLLLMVIAKRSLPPAPRPPKIRRKLIKRIIKFASGMLAFNLSVLVIIQADKIILSKILTLEHFGYYNLVYTLATSIYLIVSPINAAALPRFSQLIAENSFKKLFSTYHQTSQLMACLTIPISSVMIIFSKNIISGFLVDSVLADNFSLALSFLSLGSLISALVHTPYTLQFALGNIKIPLIVNTILIFLVLPILIVTSRSVNQSNLIVVASLMWVFVNFVYLTISVNLIHKQIMLKESKKWYTESVILPLCMALSVVSILRWIQLPSEGAYLIFSVSVAWLLLSISCILIMPFTRSLILNKTLTIS
jgi:O-antigen/teichoic acid export membrane protein